MQPKYNVIFAFCDLDDIDMGLWTNDIFLLLTLTYLFSPWLSVHWHWKPCRLCHCGIVPWRCPSLSLSLNMMQQVQFQMWRVIGVRFGSCLNSSESASLVFPFYAFKVKDDAPLPVAQFITYMKTNCPSSSDFLKPVRDVDSNRDIRADVFCLLYCEVSERPSLSLVLWLWVPQPAVTKVTRNPTGATAPLFKFHFNVTSPSKRHRTLFLIVNMRAWSHERSIPY